jgi:hypothetical protein
MMQTALAAAADPAAALAPLRTIIAGLDVRLAKLST